MPRTPEARPVVLPADYRSGKAKATLRKWHEVDQRLAGAQRYWLCTINPNGTPHCTPVDGLWLDGALYFGGSDRTRWQRNLARRRAACVHLEEPLDVVTAQGAVTLEKGVARPLAERLAAMTKQKYGYAMGAGDYQKTTILVFRPALVVAWKEFPKDVTRFEFG